MPLRPTLAALLAIGATALLLRAADETSKPAPDASPAAAEHPVDQPAQSATLDPEAMRAAFAELGHSDAALRRRALQRLMGMGRANLETFKQIVEQSRPLLPSQAAALRDVVAQAYLSGEPYPAIHGAGFLGVKLQVVAVTTPVPPSVPAGGFNVGVDAGPAAPPRLGIMIVERMPGFCGARTLMDGDLVLAIVDHPLRLTADRDYGMILAEFSQTVREIGVGKTVTFELVREGRVMRVPVKLDPRPEAADPAFGGGIGGIEELLNRRRQKAETYWSETFRSLMGERVG
jgi:hypothetical protein